MATSLEAPRQFLVSEDPATVGARWKKWKKTFGYYIDSFKKDELTDERKAAMLMHIAGPEVQDIFDTLPQPEKKLEAHLTALDKYFLPKINIRYERFLFHQTKQEATESVDTYVTRLKKLASTCEFEDLNDRIVDQVVSYCHDSRIRKKLLESEKKLTLDNVLTIARSYEAVERQVKAMERTAITEKEVKFTQSSNAHNKNKGKSNFKKGSSKKPQGATEKICTRCGHNDHMYYEKNKCPAKDAKCGKCGHLGHYQKFCKTSESKKVHTTEIVENEVKMVSSENNEESDESDVAVFAVNSVSTKRPRIMIEVELNGTPFTVQLDTGSDSTLINEAMASKIPNLALEPAIDPLIDYNGEEIPTIGIATLTVCYEGTKYDDMEVTVVKGNRKPLFGLSWLRTIPLNWNQLVKQVRDQKDVNITQNEDIELKSLLEEYKDLFEQKTGELKNIKASLKLKPDAHAKFFKARNVPYGIQAKVEQEINRLVDDGLWEKVLYADWASPIVPVVKSDGRIRICGDYKPTVNPQLQVAQHPMPKLDDILAQLAGCKYFIKLDVNDAYNTLVMDEKSQDMCILNTPFGLFKPKRLPQGIASSPALFQLEMDKIFNGLEKTFCIVDDLIIGGRTKKECLRRLRKVFERMRTYGIKLKISKCKFLVESVEYFGVKIDGEGIHKTDEKIKAITNAKEPTDVKSLQAFLGLVTFYGRFVPNLSSLANPLYKLLHKDQEWVWTDECKKAIELIKAEIISPRCLTHYDPKLPLKLVCDGSSKGVGAVLAHDMPDGTERPIAFASRSLSKAEEGYSQGEREGLSIIFGVKKFHMYLYGVTFKLVTDHQALLTILGPKKGLPAIAAARLNRWAVILSAYSYEMEYRPTKSMGNADALSRLPVDEPVEEQTVNTTLMIEAYQIPISSKTIAKFTVKDGVLAKVHEALMTGTKPTGDQFSPFLSVWDELNVEQGCVLRGARVVIPQELTKDVLKELHEGHQGIVRTKSVARTFVWWPGIDKDIENTVKNCQQCMLQSRNPPAQKYHPWECPKRAWERLHIDYAGPFMGQSFLVVVDSYSKWPEVIATKSTTSLATINMLRSLFATHGIPDRIVSDNGPQFCSEEFQKFCKMNGINHTRSPPYHPPTNGEAERLVQTFKRNLKCSQAQEGTVQMHLDRFLLSYRTTVHPTTGQTPSFLLMGRRVKTRLDLLKPNMDKERNEKGWKQLEKAKVTRDYDVNTPVLVRIYHSKQQKWTVGIISKKLGSMNYEVMIDGKTYHRHIDQLISCNADLRPTGEITIEALDTVPEECTDKQTARPPCTDNETAPQYGNSAPTVGTEPRDPIEIEPGDQPNEIVPGTPGRRQLPPRASRGKPPDRMDL